MRIETELKLGFKDVMIRPKRSTLKSRAEVSLDRNFKFLHSTTLWTGIPIMAANMDTVGTFEIAAVLAKEKLLQLFINIIHLKNGMIFYRTSLLISIIILLLVQAPAKMILLKLLPLLLQIHY